MERFDQNSGKWKRGAQTNPPNRFESTVHEINLADFDDDPEARSELLAPDQRVKTRVYIDHAKSILTRNDSPDICFNVSVNPYRGCEHGCAYCYARPTHEALGMNAGLDFESKIMVKLRAPELLRAEISKKGWEPEPIVFSGVTDCYQPLERRFRLTRSCLEVLAEFRNPAFIITKNALVLRDIDLLADMAKQNLIKVMISVTTLNESLAQKLEPRTSLPAQRLHAVSTLAGRGVPVGILMAPVIPGLTDTEIPALLRACADAGATSAGYTPLRLPLSVQPVFLSWLEEFFPEKVGKVTSAIKHMRGGQMNDPNFGSRMRGHGEQAQMLAHTFQLFARRFGLIGRDNEGLDCSRFRVPGSFHQPSLFSDDGSL